MIHLFALLSLLLCGVCYTGFQNSSHFHNTSNRRSLLLLVFGGALLLRLLLAYTTHGFSNDIACFAAWADRQGSSILPRCLRTIRPVSCMYCI